MQISSSFDYKLTLFFCRGANFWRQQHTTLIQKKRTGSDFFGINRIFLLAAAHFFLEVVAQTSGGNNIHYTVIQKKRTGSDRGHQSYFLLLAG
jgi:hypothetical protein